MITAHTSILTSGVFSGEKYCIRDVLESRYWVQAQCCPGTLRQIWYLQKYLFSFVFCCFYCCRCGCCCLWSAPALVSGVHVLLCDLVTCRAARRAEDTLFNLDNPAPNQHSRKYSGVFQERKPVFPSSQISRRRGMLSVRRLFADCSCPPTLRFPLVHSRSPLGKLFKQKRGSRGIEQGWEEDERGEMFRQAAPQRCYLLTANWWMKTLAQHVKLPWAELSQFSCCVQARLSALYLHVRTTNKESHSKWTKCSATGWWID